MGKFIKNSLPERVAEQIRQQVSDGRWGHRLPGVRVLAEEMSVSRDTMMRALRILESWGVLDPAVAGKARVLAEEVRASGRAPSLVVPCSRVVFFLNSKYGQLGRVDREFTDSLTTYLREQGRTCELVEISILGRDDSSVAEIVANHPADTYAVLRADEDSVRWFFENDKKVLFVGGDIGSVPGFFYGFSGVDLIRKSFNHLYSLGHRRIVFPVPSVCLEDSESGRAFEGRIRGIFESKGVAVSRFNYPTWDESTKGFMDLLERSFALTPPTAIVLWRASDAPTLVSFMMRRGMRYPEDLSIVVMDDHPLLDGFVPRLAVAAKTPKTLAKKVATKIAELALAPPSEPTENEHVVLPGKLVVYESTRSLLRPGGSKSPQ